MSTTGNNNYFFSNMDSKNMNHTKKPENVKQTSYVNKNNKFPILIEKGDNNYKYSSRDQYLNEERKENKNKNPIMLNKLNNKQIKEINKDEEYDKSIIIGTKRQLKDSKQINEDYIKEEVNIEEQLNQNYEKNIINSNQGEGYDTNIASSLNPGKCFIVMRTILYNLIRPVYLYLLAICIILCFPDYSDLPIMVSIIIYLIIIITSIIIEISEEKNAINNLIFFDQSSQYDKITNNNVIKIPGKNVQKNDILVIKKDTICPCDMIIIDSSANSLPLFFQSDYLTGDYGFTIRVIKKKLSKKFTEIKKTFDQYFSEFIKNLESEEIKKMLDEQKKIKQSQLIYKDFLERNDLMVPEEEEKKLEKERQKKLFESKFDPNNKIYEDLKRQEYYKYFYSKDIIIHQKKKKN